MPGLDLVLAKSAMMAVIDPVAIPTYAVSNVGSGLEPRSTQAERVTMVSTAIVLMVDTTIVMMSFDVAGIVKFISGNLN